MLKERFSTEFYGCYSNSFGGKNHIFPVFVSLVGLIEDLAGNGEKLVTQARRFLP